LGKRLLVIFIIISSWFAFIEVFRGNLFAKTVNEYITINGTVADEKNNVGIEDVRISVSNCTTNTHSEIDGKYTVIISKNVAINDTIFIFFKKAGYTPKIVPVRIKDVIISNLTTKLKRFYYKSPLPRYLNFQINGKICDRNKHCPICGAKIHATKTLKQVNSSENGNFEIFVKNIDPLEYMFLWVEKDGYNSKAIKVRLKGTTSYDVKDIYLESTELTDITINFSILEATKFNSIKKVEGVLIEIDGDPKGLTNQRGELKTKTIRSPVKQIIDVNFSHKWYEDVIGRVVQLNKKNEYNIIQKLIPSENLFRIRIFKNENKGIEDVKIFLKNTFVGKTNSAGVSLIKCRAIPNDILLVKLPISYSPVDTHFVFKENKKDYKIQVRRKTFNGTFSVASKPTNAEVYIDDSRQALGYTPLKNVEIPAGKHNIRLVLKDHEKVTKSITVKENENFEIDNILLKKNEGKIQISTNLKEKDRSAYVHLNEERIGKTNSRTGIINLVHPVGPYRLEIKKEKYVDFVQDVRIRADETTEISCDLVKIKRDVAIKSFLITDLGEKDTLSIDTLLVDGYLVPIKRDSNRIFIENLEVGRHTIIPKKTGYVVKKKEIIVKENGLNEYEIIMKPKLHFYQYIKRVIGNPVACHFEYLNSDKNNGDKNISNFTKTKAQYIDYSQISLVFRKDSLYANKLDVQTKFSIPSFLGLGISVQPTYRYLEKKYLTISPFVKLSGALFGSGIGDKANGFFRTDVGTKLEFGRTRFLSVCGSGVKYLWMPYKSLTDKIKNFAAYGIQLGIKIAFPKDVMDKFDVFGWFTIDPARFPVVYNYIKVKKGDLHMRKHVVQIGFLF
jgi:hypothetical protein